MLADSLSNKEKEDLEAECESRQFRAGTVPKHVYEPLFQTMVEQFPNRLPGPALCLICYFQFT
jgi:hypothetical protein